MSKACKCDRCGKLYESYNTRSDKNKINGIITINIDENRKYWSHGPYDLCSTCSDEFTQWFNNT